MIHVQACVTLSRKLINKNVLEQGFPTCIGTRLAQSKINSFVIGVFLAVGRTLFPILTKTSRINQSKSIDFNNVLITHSNHQSKSFFFLCCLTFSYLTSISSFSKKKAETTTMMTAFEKLLTVLLLLII